MRMRLHHVALASPKAHEAVDWYTQDWGLREAGRDGDSVRLAAATDRGDDYSLVLVKSDRKAVDHFCLVAEDEAEFDAVAQRVRDNELRVVDEFPLSPGLVAGFSIIDLDGRRVELAYRPAGGDDAEPVGEVPDAVPMFPGHIVLNTEDIKATTEWYEKKLGFGVREWRAQKMSFLYSNEDHHTVAFNSAPHFSLNHIAWELGDINQFFRAVGRAGQSPRGSKIYGPGRHGPGDYVFCYFLDPMEFICEFETGGVKILDPADFPFRVLEFTPQSVDQWMGVLSGGVNQQFRKATLGRPDEGLFVNT